MEEVGVKVGDKLEKGACGLLCNNISLCNECRRNSKTAQNRSLKLDHYNPGKKGVECATFDTCNFNTENKSWCRCMYCRRNTMLPEDATRLDQYHELRKEPEEIAKEALVCFDKGDIEGARKLIIQLIDEF